MDDLYGILLRDGNIFTEQFHLFDIFQNYSKNHIEHLVELLIHTDLGLRNVIDTTENWINSEIEKNNHKDESIKLFENISQISETLSQFMEKEGASVSLQKRLYSVIFLKLLIF